MAEFACSERCDALNGGVSQNVSPERHPDFLAEAANLWQVHGVAIECQRLNLLIVNNAAKLPVHVHLKVTAFRFVVISITVVAPGNNVRVISDCFYQVDVSRWFECNHQSISPCNLSAVSSARIRCRACCKPVARAATSDWGNGASFDCVILRNSYSLTGQPVPWQWWNDRDVRTIVELGKVIGFDPKRDMPFKGTRHNALDDAIHQAKYVSAIWKKLAK